MPTRALAYRRSRTPTGASHGLRLGLIAAAFGLLALVALAVVGVGLRLAARLPDVGQIEAQFGLRGAESFQPMLVFDRTGQSLLYRHLNPAAQQAEWVELIDLPGYLPQGVVAAQDPDFWTNRGYSLAAPVEGQSETIASRLVEASLLPSISNPLAARLSVALLSAELSNRYSKERVLTWYLNSADFGRAAFGVDAAALVYFGKHARQLTLSESALLAALAHNAALDPNQQPLEAVAARERVLQAMPELSHTEAQRAAGQPLNVRSETARWDRPGFSAYLLAQLEGTIGRAAIGRSGLRVLSTLDQDLQDQAGCAAESHLARLSGNPIATTVAARGGRPCVAAALLPTLRPGDAGVDHGVEDWAMVILDPTSGELLAASGAIETPHGAGPIIDPFIYLTAFARGSAPASMVLDLGPDLSQSHGPVRMRTALANLYPYAIADLQSSMGADAIQRTLSQIGLGDRSGGGNGVSLLDLASAYGVFAANGVRSGLESAGQMIRPSILREVRQSDGSLLYAFDPSEQAILSPQLSNLMVDVLSDEPARWPSLGQGNLLEVGFPVGVVSGLSAAGENNWSIGFSSQRVVGVWLGGTPLRRVDRLNGAASIWHAVMRFASANLTARGWQRPPGMSAIEVCDPSGLLPTSYCPSVVRELFAPGTEPTSFDNLYQPVRVNRETGKLATLFTPLESVEERVYFVPPPAAEPWAEAVGIELPPEEYDPLSVDGPSWPGVEIRSPAPFEILANRVAILGEAAPEDFEYYRLQYGQGLNPAHWVQIGGDQRGRGESGRLGTWSTEGLNGLFTLQLLVILDDGQVRTAAVPVTIDNQPPQAGLTFPANGDHFSLRVRASLTLEAEVLDDVALQRVEFLINGRRMAIAHEAPYRFNWQLEQTGAFEMVVRAYDVAGNRTDSLPITVTIDP